MAVLNQVSNQVAALARAKELVKNYLEAKKQKADYEKTMKEAIFELEQLAIENKSSWFTDLNSGELRKSCDFDTAKLVWKKAATKYEFKSIELDNVVAFAKKFPNSIKFEFKAMTNIDLDEFGIEKTEGKESLNVE